MGPRKNIHSEAPTRVESAKQTKNEGAATGDHPLADDVTDANPPADDVTQEHNSPESGEDSEGDLIDNISPAKELNAALREQREMEKEAFDMLIKGNVSLKRELKKTDERCKELLAKCEVKSIELDAERGKTAHLERQVEEMRTEMTALIRAAKKASVVNKRRNKGSRKGKESAEGQSAEGSDKEDKYGASHSDEDSDNEGREEDRRKINELQLRLLRFSEEDERKSRLLISLQRDLESSTRYTEKLESHVDSDVKDELMNDADTDHEGMTFMTASKANNIVYAGKPQAYSYRRNIAKESVVCVIS